jgi:hypothetical protein
MTIETANNRLKEIGEKAQAGDFAQAAADAKALAEDLNRASRPVQPNFRSPRGASPEWDPNHQRYAAALQYVRSIATHAARADSAGTLENVEKAQKALAPHAEAQ